jgi:UDP-N-acetylmuramoylalanine--D-glutamate ligase
MGKVLIYGMGKTGKAVVDFLSKQGIENYIMVDEEEGIYNKDVIISPDRINKFKKDVELVVKSPGIPISEVKKYIDNVEIISEIEFAYRALEKKGVSPKIIAITGTDGKTTASVIAYNILLSKYDAVLCGNVGIPFISKVDKINQDTVVVLELSSYQLEDINMFSSYISVILNLKKDHLDRYDSIGDYWEAKMNIIKNQEKGDFFIINKDDDVLASLIKEREILPTLISFSREVDVSSYVYVEGDYIVLGDEAIDINDIYIPFEHFSDSILGAISVAKLMGVKVSDMVRVLSRFKGIPHRFEFIGMHKGRKVINDSKATTVSSVMKALNTLGHTNDIVLIMGGLYKDGDFGIIGDEIKKRGIRLVLYGSAINNLLRFFDGISYEKRENFDDAVRIAWKISKKEDIILLSPGCASWDQHENFEERGDRFLELIRKI